MTDLRENLQWVAGQLNDFDQPQHDDAVTLWPILLPLYGSHLMAERSLEHLGFRREANLCGRVAEALRETMIDAELGLRKATPEQRVQHAEEEREAHG